MISYAFLWLLVIAFIVIMYIILDGFTLGVGLLFPWVRNSKDRDTMIATVLPVWDGNETWLVFAGAALYAGFPDAFGVLMSALYLPFILLIVGLLFRGVSFEFIHKANKTVHIWEKCFFAGSLMAVTAQGLIVGSYVQGFVIDPISHDIVVPNIINWFNLFCILALIIGYTLLGSARLMKKTSGELQSKFFKVSSNLQWFLLLAVLFVGFYSPTSVAESWLKLHNSPFILMFTIVAILLMIIHSVAIKKHIENLPFMALLGIYIIAYIGFIASNLPYIVPRQMTFMEAKVDDGAFILMLYGVSVLLPLLLFYTAYAYHVFGGKVDGKTHY
jgi:cytochrome d ubiquinol oxidase subunit II